MIRAPRPRDFWISVSLAVVMTAASSQAIPSGYLVDSTQAIAPRPVFERYDDGDFTLAILREFRDSTAACLLGIAEATYPPRDVLNILSEEMATEIGPDSAKVPLWWYDGVGVLRVPYAVTAGALEYYRDLTRRFRSHNFWGAFARSLFWTDLNYHAVITRQDEYFIASEVFTDVYVAELNLAWGYDDGTFVPVSVAYRIVVLSPEGEVLLVVGDGMVRESVWFSAHRGIGFAERVMR